MIRSTLLLLTVLLATTVSAQDFSYSYIQGGLVYVDDRASGMDLDAYGGFVGGSDTDSGVNFDAGFRLWVTDYLEFNVGAGVTKLSDSDNDASAFAGLNFYANDNISVGLSGQWRDSEIASYGLGLRYNFGN